MERLLLLVLQVTWMAPVQRHESGMHFGYQEVW
jgi:hypothetical protein